MCLFLDLVCVGMMMSLPLYTTKMNICIGQAWVGSDCNGRSKENVLEIYLTNPGEEPRLTFPSYVPSFDFQLDNDLQ